MSWAIDAECEEAALAALAELGCVVETDWRPNRVELAAPGRGWVDLHPSLLAEDGSARQAALDGGFHVFPAAFFTVGSLDGVPVCPASLRRHSDSFTGGTKPGLRIFTTSICSRGSSCTTAVLVQDETLATLEGGAQLDRPTGAAVSTASGLGWFADLALAHAGAPLSFGA